MCCAELGDLCCVCKAAMGSSQSVLSQLNLRIFFINQSPQPLVLHSSKSQTGQRGGYSFLYDLAGVYMSQLTPYVKMVFNIVCFTEKLLGLISVAEIL